MKKLILLLITMVQLICFAQFENLQKISLDGFGNTSFEKSSLFQSNDSLIYFYHASGSPAIKVELSVDFGVTWTNLYTISFTGLPIADFRSYDVFQKEDGNFLIAKLFFGGGCRIFNYNLTTNTATQIGSGISTTANEVELCYVDGTNFIVSFKDNQDNIFYYYTNDGAVTWSEQKHFAQVQTKNRAITISKHDDKLYGALTSSDSLSINLLVSIDGGVSFNFIEAIFSSTNKVSNASIHSDGTSLYLVFEEHLLVNETNEYQTDVSYLISTDGGTTWSEKIKYTKYVRNDIISDINNSLGNIIILTLSNRTELTKMDTYFGDLAFSLDPAPPVLYWSKFPNPIQFDVDFPIQLLLLDESGIGSVTAEFNDEFYTLYDDGLHSDSLPGDNIFGNMITGYPANSSFDPSSATVSFVNNIIMPFNNKGILADVNIYAFLPIKISFSDIDNHEEEFQKNLFLDNELAGSLGRYDNIGFLFSGGFFLSGYYGSTLWANGVASASLIEDYVPGKVGSSTDDSDNLIYSILKGDPPFGQAWQNWKKAVEQGAYFYDGDNDGIYDPVDKNGNGQWDTNEDKPDILYDATYFTTYNDGVPASQRRYNSVDPMGIEIRQTIFASNQNSILDDVLFIRYSLHYKGINYPNEPDSLTDIIFSIWTDSDIGDAYDDLVGCDTLLNSGFTYNDTYDGGQDGQFGVNPPAVFKAIVQGPRIKSSDQNDEAFNRMGPGLGEEVFPGYINGKLNAFVHYQGGDPDLRDPSDSYDLRNYAQGIPPRGEQADPCDWPYGDVFGGVNCAEIDPYKWYSGDPLTEYGWLNTVGSDQRDMASTAEFTLTKNEPMDIIVAYVVGRGTSALNSLEKTREITKYVHEEYERNFSTIVGIDDEPEEVVNTFSLSQNYPNPFNPTTTIQYTIPNVGNAYHAFRGNTKLIVYDILGREVKTLVNEIKSPGNYEVTFDASQLASGVYFYRLTSGSFVQTKKMILLR